MVLFAWPILWWIHAAKMLLALIIPLLQSNAPGMSRCSCVCVHEGRENIIICKIILYCFMAQWKWMFNAHCTHVAKCIEMNTHTLTHISRARSLCLSNVRHMVCVGSIVYLPFVFDPGFSEPVSIFGSFIGRKTLLNELGRNKLSPLIHIIIWCVCVCMSQWSSYMNRFSPSC